MMNIHTNPQLELAFDYIRETSTSIFLTGKAGTGKTTFLRRVRQDAGKRLVVAAPTGVAAINAGGVTLHSLFQLPFGLFLPEGQRPQEQRRYSREKLNLIRSMELLVIDEISMVRCDLLDAVDESLRRLRNDDRPFGNIQLLMIGDLHQLPPVVKPEDWDTLQRYYDTPYFFGSLALRQSNYVSIELKHIYRQSDATFIELLNKVRDNCLDNESLRLLNSRYVRNFQAPQNEAYITLTSTNAVAHEINGRNLGCLPGATHAFVAQVEGNFPESAYPTEERLEFKPGAQVMFIKNDPSPEKRFFNGRIGCITSIDDGIISVRCAGDASDIAVTPAEWMNVKYTLNEQTKEIEEQVLGMFVQMPLKLAWAITIHKSQGLTFDRAIIDAAAAFAHGQVYVALSRCKTFEGIVLLSPIHYTSVKTDPKVQSYTAEADRNAPGPQEIQVAKRLYQQQLIEELFSFERIVNCLSRLRSTYQEHQATLATDSLEQVSGLARTAHEVLTAISDRFSPQLAGYLHSELMPEANHELQMRIGKAAGYFTEQLSSLLQAASELPTQTDNQAVRSTVHRQFEQLMLQLFTKRALFAACSQGFTTLKYKRAQADAEIDFGKSVVRPTREEAVPVGAEHPELYAELLKYRRQMSEQYDVSPRSVIPTDTLEQLVKVLPTTQRALSRIRGIARKRLERYGQDIVGIVQRYCQVQQIVVDEITAAKATASGTKQLTFEMWQAGKSIQEIARARSLSEATIAGHLAFYVGLQQLDIHDLLSAEKLAEIERFSMANPEASLGDAKTHFGSKYDYGELRLAFSHLRKDVH
jgi:hypothetical protein